LTCDPSRPDFQVPELGLDAGVPPLRFQRRQSLLQQVNRHLDGIERSPVASRFDTQSRQAFDLLRSSRARRAFDLDEEPPAVRDRYGRHRFGQSVLLARRLVEAGVSLVQVNWTRDASDRDDNPVWDTHTKNAERLKTALMPPMDAAYSALLEDLSARGLLDETLVVWMGEFGRSPKINPAGGRDHWGRVFSVALAGGGVRGGQVYGASDRLGGEPRDGCVRPQDLTATIFDCLGYRPETELHDALGRPVRLSTGEALRRLF
jgi:arylsulfatase A-like enzyme